jgi:hypothetical protein
MMTNISWKQFLFIHVPGTALALTLVVQGIALSLSGVAMLRDRPDELALAVLKDPTDYRVVLLGDSITRISTVRFSLGEPGEVANLATNATVALTGSLFILQRYLSTHASPDHVVVALAPALYHYGNEVRVTRYNLWLTFNQPNERDFLRTYVPGIEQRDWLPAVLNVQERVVEPFFSLLAQRHLVPHIEIGALIANADAPVDFAIRPVGDNGEKLGDRANTALSDMNAEALRRLCGLGAQYGFRINIAWPPLPAQLENVLASNGALMELEARIKSIMDGHCDFDGFTDFNKIRTYPNLAFRNDLAHLFSDGWDQRYAADMREYLGGLLHSAPARGPAPAIEASGIGRSLPNQP